jgi:hypothetical protein
MECRAHIQTPSLLLADDYDGREMMMKLAWLCYLHDEDDLLPVIRFEEPERWIYRKIVPIVYAILEVDNDE